MAADYNIAASCEIARKVYKQEGITLATYHEYWPKIVCCEIGRKTGCRILARRAECENSANRQYIVYFDRISEHFLKGVYVAESNDDEDEIEHALLDALYSALVEVGALPAGFGQLCARYDMLRPIILCVLPWFEAYFTLEASANFRRLQTRTPLFGLEVNASLDDSVSALQTQMQEFAKRYWSSYLCLRVPAYAPSGRLWTLGVPNIRLKSNVFNVIYDSSGWDPQQRTILIDVQYLHPMGDLCMESQRNRKCLDAAFSQYPHTLLSSDAFHKMRMFCTGEDVLAPIMGDLNETIDFVYGCRMQQPPRKRARVSNAPLVVSKKRPCVETAKSYLIYNVPTTDESGQSAAQIIKNIFKLVKIKSSEIEIIGTVRRPLFSPDPYHVRLKSSANAPEIAVFQQALLASTHLKQYFIRLFEPAQSSRQEQRAEAETASRSQLTVRQKQHAARLLRFAKEFAASISLSLELRRSDTMCSITVLTIPDILLAGFGSAADSAEAVYHSVSNFVLELTKYGILPSYFAELISEHDEWGALMVTATELCGEYMLEVLRQPEYAELMAAPRNNRMSNEKLSLKLQFTETIRAFAQQHWINHVIFVPVEAFFPDDVPADFQVRRSTPPEDVSMQSAAMSLPSIEESNSITQSATESSNLADSEDVVSSSTQNLISDSDELAMSAEEEVVERELVTTQDEPQLSTQRLSEAEEVMNGDAAVPHNSTPVHDASNTFSVESTETTLTLQYSASAASSSTAQSPGPTETIQVVHAEQAQLDDSQSLSQHADNDLQSDHQAMLHCPEAQSAADAAPSLPMLGTTVDQPSEQEPATPEDSNVPLAVSASSPLPNLPLEYCQEILQEIRSRKELLCREISEKYYMVCQLAAEAIKLEAALATRANAPSITLSAEASPTAHLPASQSPSSVMPPSGQSTEPMQPLAAIAAWPTLALPNCLQKSYFSTFLPANTPQYSHAQSSSAATPVSHIWTYDSLDELGAASVSEALQTLQSDLPAHIPSWCVEYIDEAKRITPNFLNHVCSHVKDHVELRELLREPKHYPMRESADGPDAAFCEFHRHARLRHKTTNCAIALPWTRRLKLAALNEICPLQLCTTVHAAGTACPVPVNSCSICGDDHALAWCKHFAKDRQLYDLQD